MPITRITSDQTKGPGEDYQHRIPCSESKAQSHLCFTAVAQRRHVGILMSKLHTYRLLLWNQRYHALQMTHHTWLPYTLGQVHAWPKLCCSGGVTLQQVMQQGVAARFHGHQSITLQSGLQGSIATDVYPCRQYSAVELKTVFEAAWAITNMAAGPHECVEAVLPAAPMLVVLLRTNSSTHIAEQSAWALGKPHCYSLYLGLPMHAVHLL